jgi:spore maturation protein CgeB
LFKIMKILVAWSKWHAEIGESLALVFKDLGHETEIFYDNPGHWSLLASKIFWRSPWQKHASSFRHYYQSFVGEKLIKKTKEWRPDLIFVIRGAYFPPGVIQEIRDFIKIPVANWVIDDPGFSNIYEPPALRSLQAYSHFFIVDESWSWYLKFLSKAPIFYLPHAGDEKIYRPLDAIKKKDLDIFFVGSLSPRYPNTASGFLRASILNHLANQNFEITAVAPGINEMFKFYPALKKINLLPGYQPAAKINEYYNRAKIVLNVNAPQLKTDFSDRLFTIALAKSFQLVDFKDKLPALFRRGEEIAFRNLEELVSKAKFYLSNPEKREEISESFYKEALQKHTYKNRAQEILGKIFQ